MRVVIDSSLLIALVSGDDRSPEVHRQFVDWIESDTDLHAPLLVWYEGRLFNNASASGFPVRLLPVR